MPRSVRSTQGSNNRQNDNTQMGEEASKKKDNWGMQNNYKRVILLEITSEQNLEEQGIAVGPIIEYCLWIVFIMAILCGALLTIKAQPIIRLLERDIKDPANTNNEKRANCFLEKIEGKYRSLMKNTDMINVQIFSSGEIGAYRIFKIRADKLQLFINQAPALLVSIGLLGTFAGLTTGLAEIQDVLRPNISPQDATLGLGKIIAPMSLAFKTSLQGLTFSLLLTVIFQITGWKNVLDQLNELLASWLETVLPVKKGEKLSTPMREAIVNLNNSTKDLPKKIEEAISKSMSNSFSEKLDEFFEIYSNLSNESIRIINSLGSLAASFRESSGDYLEASGAFQNCSFAEDLEKCVQGLNESKIDVIHSTEKLCDKLTTMRADIAGVKSSWEVLTSLSSEQFRSARDMMETNNLQTKALEKSINSCNENSIELTRATKELRNTRLEVGRDRKSMQESVSAIENRLNAGSQLDNSHTNLINTYHKVIENWRLSTEQMGVLYNTIIEDAQNKSTSVYDKTLATSRVYEEITKKNSENADRLIRELSIHLENIEHHYKGMLKTIRDQSESYLSLVDRAEKANQTFDSLLESKNKEGKGWNQPWRFGK